MLQSEGLFIEDDSRIHFLETRELKISRISELACQVFIDDLPEVLQAPGFLRKPQAFYSTLWF